MTTVRMPTCPLTATRMPASPLTAAQGSQMSLPPLLPVGREPGPTTEAPGSGQDRCRVLHQAQRAVMQGTAVEHCTLQRRRGAQATITGSGAACAPTWLHRHQRREGPKPACSGSPRSPALLGGGSQAARTTLTRKNHKLSSISLYRHPHRPWRAGCIPGLEQGRGHPAPHSRPETGPTSTLPCGISTGGLPDAGHVSEDLPSKWMCGQPGSREATCEWQPPPPPRPQAQAWRALGPDTPLWVRRESESGPGQPLALPKHEAARTTSGHLRVCCASRERIGRPALPAGQQESRGSQVGFTVDTGVCQRCWLEPKSKHTAHTAVPTPGPWSFPSMWFPLQEHVQ